MIDISTFGYVCLFPFVLYLTFLFGFFKTKNEGDSFYDVINTGYEESTMLSDHSSENFHDSDRVSINSSTMDDEFVYRYRR